MAQRSSCMYGSGIQTRFVQLLAACGELVNAWSLAKKHKANSIKCKVARGSLPW